MARGGVDFIKSNPNLNNILMRIRRRRQLSDALKNNNINVQTTQEKQDETEDVSSQVSGALGLDVETVGTSRAIEDAQEMMDVAGVGAGQTAGEVARDIAEKNREFSDPFAEAFTSIGGTEGAAAIAGTTALGAFYAGAENVAKGAFQATKLLSGPGGLALNIIGPTERAPYGKPVAMGSGALAQVSGKVMDIHYGVADKMAQGIAGYDQGYLNGQLVSLSPGFFGGQVLTGNVPMGLSASDFADMLSQSREREDEDAISGMARGNPLAMMEAGITTSDYSSPTEAARAGMGYSSYDAKGNPTGAAPAGSQYSATGIFSSGSSDGGDDSGSVSSVSDAADDPAEGFDFNKGGSVSMQEGGDPTQQQQAPTGEMGFVGGPPDKFTEQQTIADDIPKTVPEGAFVINAPAVEFAGKEDIKKMLIDAYEKAGLDKSNINTKIPSKEQVDIMISRGEVIVPPEVAKVIGYDRLEKINNRGKKEVARRKEESQQQEKPQARMASNGGFMSPDLNSPFFTKTTPATESFVPGISDEPIPMTTDDVRFFGDFRFGDIKKAIRKTEIQGFEDNPYIFTGSKAKGGKGSSAFGPMQITYSLLKDFIDRSEEYSTLTKEQQDYVKALLVQGEDKVNKELYGVVKRGPKDKRIDYTPMQIFGEKAKDLKPRGIGVLDPKLHKKHYDAVADAVLLHKLGDHDTIEKALASYGEGAEYSEKVLNDLLDLTQTGFLSKPVKSK